MIIHIIAYRNKGNFSDYEEWMKKTYGTAAVEPKRMKYKRIG